MHFLDLVDLGCKLSPFVGFNDAHDLIYIIWKLIYFYYIMLNYVSFVLSMKLSYKILDQVSYDLLGHELYFYWIDKYVVIVYVMCWFCYL